jgi:PAS domain S-box-containing protein
LRSAVQAKGAPTKDVTEQANAEDALRGLADAGRFFELSSDMLCTASFDGIFRELNGAWEEALGWSEGELCSKPFIEFVHPDDVNRTAEKTADLSQGGDTVEFLNRYATKDGGWRWLEWNASGVVDEGLIYASARDVSARIEVEQALRRTEAELTAARDEALEASRQKSAFLVNVSHQISTPLNDLIGMADLLLDSQLDPEQRDNARLLKGASETLTTVVGDLLDFLRLEAGAPRTTQIGR